MPFVFIIIGVVMVVAAARNTLQTGPNNGPGLLTLLKGDFTGQGNYIYWVISILIIGAVGYVPDLKPVSRAFLVLVIIVLFLSKGNPKLASGGVFSQFTKAIGITQNSAPATVGLQNTPATQGLPFGGL